MKTWIVVHWFTWTPFLPTFEMNTKEDQYSNTCVNFRPVYMTDYLHDVVVSRQMFLDGSQSGVVILVANKNFTGLQVFLERLLTGGLHLAVENTNQRLHQR